MDPSPMPGDHSLLGVRDIICVVIVSDCFLGLFFFKLSSYMSSLSPDLESLNISFYFPAQETSCTYLSAIDNNLWLV